jgi:hypothetical protein
MYKSVLEFNFKDFDTANYIFNDFDHYFGPSMDLIPLSNISDNLYMPILKKHGFDITWEDIENNEELYKLLEEMVNDANYDAEYIGFLSGHMLEYTKKFDYKIGEFLEDEGIYDYIHNIQADIDTDKGVFRIKYEYDDKNIMDYFSADEDDYYENKEYYRKEFEYEIKLDTKGIIRDFDEYMGRVFADARGYEFYDFKEGEKAFMDRFEDLVIEYKDKLKKLIGK